MNSYLKEIALNILKATTAHQGAGNIGKLVVRNESKELEIELKDGSRVLIKVFPSNDDSENKEPHLHLQK